jgi:hypothetical protein
MSKEIDREKFSIYRFRTDEQLCVAVPNAFKKVVTEAVQQYGSLQEVPNDKTVRGVFVHRHGEKYHFIDNNEQQNDITINQLEEAG